MFVTIDRLEGENAVIELETTDMVCVPLALFRGLGVKEGDVLEIQISKKETQARRARVQKLMDDLFED